jgi:hypothetical protein
MAETLRSLTRAEKATRAELNEAIATQLEAEAALRRQPSRGTLDAVDDAKRARRHARDEWNRAYERLELATAGAIAA